MLQVKLRDGSFPQSNSATLAGDNSGQVPAFFEWDRDPDPGPVTWFTDICLAQALDDTSPKKIAWLIEPPEISANHYQFVLDNPGLFDHVLTWDREFIGKIDNGLLYYFGGCWVDSWRIYDKTADVSLIASRKNSTVGHKLRHEIAGRYRDWLDLFGAGYQEIPSKKQALAPYRYSVVIENTRRDWWFTEKIIDSFLTGTVPIYWGCDLFGLFNPDGVITFNKLDDLEAIFNYIGPADYNLRRDAIQANFDLARRYVCVEDWLYRFYPFLFR
jgi:hypothetical protein